MSHTQIKNVYTFVFSTYVTEGFFRSLTSILTHKSAFEMCLLWTFLGVVSFIINLETEGIVTMKLIGVI